MIGLGNPGPRYADTRHNLGFRVADRFARRLDARFTGEAGVSALTARGEVRDVPVVVAKPLMFMNLSGYPVAALIDRLEVPPEDVVVVFDDSDLELGRIRIRPDGGDGGHNGVSSIIEHLGTDRFPRIKLGIRGEDRDDGDLADYVLSPFPAKEREVADRLVDVGVEAARTIVLDGVAPAMNRFNGTRVPLE